MPSIPSKKVLTNTSVDVLNVIRNNASQNYKDYIPFAQPEADSIKAIGNIIMDFPELQNEFLNALVNRIGRVIVTSKTYDNPWSVFKRGIMDFGETIEEIFVNIATPFDFNPELAETEVFKRVIPDVRSAFHIMNFQKMYKVTISNDQLRQAFLSWDGITDLIAKITESMYTAANYDEFLTMRYLLAKQILNNKMYFMNIDGVDTEANSKNTVKTIKEITSNLEFPSNKYNVAGVKTQSLKADQYIIMNTAFDAAIDVDVLAAAFNLTKVEFMGRKITAPMFGDLDNDRLAELFANDPTFTPITPEQSAMLNKVGCVIVDKDYFMILDNLIQFTEVYNGQGLYWNYFYHTWKTFSVSPFANAICAVIGGTNTTAISENNLAVYEEGSSESIGTLADVTLHNGKTYTVFNTQVDNSLPATQTVLLTAENTNDLTIVNGNKIIVNRVPEDEDTGIIIHNYDGTTSTVYVTVHE